MDKPYETSRGLLWAGTGEIYGGARFTVRAAQFSRTQILHI